MPARMLFSRRPVVVGAVASLALLVSFWTLRGVAKDDPPKPQPIARNVAIAADVTRLVDVKLSEKLDGADAPQYTVEATLTNDGRRPLAGPLALAVKSTGIATLKTDDFDGLLVTGEPFFVLFDGQQLEPEKSAPARRLTFRAPRPLRDSQTERFDLKFRIVRLLDPNGRFTLPAAGLPGLAASNFGIPSVMRGNTAPKTDETPAPQPPREPYQLRPEITDQMVDAAMRVQEKHTPKLMQQEGVFGTATGVTEDGDLVIRIYVERHGIAKAMPESLDGIRVETKVTSPIRPLQAPPQDKEAEGGLPPTRPTPQNPAIVPADQRSGFPLPVPIGVSVGVDGEFAAGTLGFRLRAEDGTIYGLSNNHVFADINTLLPGTVIVQPSLLDTVLKSGIGANLGITDATSSNIGPFYPPVPIGTLATFVPIIPLTDPPNVPNFPFPVNYVDCAIIQTDAQHVGNSAFFGSYGTPNSCTVSARLGMKIEKAGRTTGITTGFVTGVNLSLVVTGEGFFDNQIEISAPVSWTNPISGRTGTGPPSINQDTGVVQFIFGDEGDSGSGIVTSTGKNPVALLYAGNGSITIANPIDAVLEALSQQLGKKLTIDGSPCNSQ